MKQKKPLIAITGASSGIGAACAQLFHEQGYPLLLMARRVEILEAYQFTNCICRSVDVQDYAAFQQAIDEAQAIYGPVDLLINNAGIMILDNVDNLTLEQQHAMVNINVIGVMNGVKTVLHSMIEREHGTIINTSSVAGRWVTPARAAYSATKYAVHAYSEGLRKEVGKHNIRVITFAPGIVDTNLLHSVENQTILHAYEAYKNEINQGLTSEEAAEIIRYAYQLPQNVCLKELICTHTKQDNV